MKKNKNIVILILVFVLLLGGAYVLYNRFSQTFQADQLAVQEDTSQKADPQQSDEEADRVPAPDFTVYDENGNPVQLSDFIGKPVVLNFWASWCGPCQSEMPDFNAAYEQLGDQVHFMMLNVTDGSRETVESASAFIEEQGYTFPVYYDTQSSASITYGTYSLPTTYFIDAEGYAVAQATGAIDSETLQRGLDLILLQ